jgi:hypothetical protein
MTRKQWISGIAMIVFLAALSGCQESEKSAAPVAPAKPAAPAEPVKPAVTAPAKPAETVPAKPAPAAPVAATPAAPKAPVAAAVPTPPPAPVVPAAPKLVIRVNCGATKPYTDKAGNLWLPDEVKVPGASLSPLDGTAIERTQPFEVPDVQYPEIFRTERYSMSAYEFNLPNGKYSVRLHFAETYEGITAVGQRVFSFAIQGQEPVKDFDIFKEAGGAYKAIVRRYRNVEVTDGKLKIVFTANVQNPAINGIVIRAE